MQLSRAVSSFAMSSLILAMSAGKAWRTVYAPTGIEAFLFSACHCLKLPGLCSALLDVLMQGISEFKYKVIHLGRIGCGPSL
jgi:hypothetical protein